MRNEWHAEAWAPHTLTGWNHLLRNELRMTRNLKTLGSSAAVKAGSSSIHASDVAPAFNLQGLWWSEGTKSPWKANPKRQCAFPRRWRALKTPLCLGWAKASQRIRTHLRNVVPKHREWLPHWLVGGDPVKACGAYSEPELPISWNRCGTYRFSVIKSYTGKLI